MSTLRLKISLTLACLVFSLLLCTGAFATPSPTVSTDTQVAPVDTSTDLAPVVSDDGQEVVYKSHINITKNFMARKYILGPNDVISVLVPDYPDYNQLSLQVQPDGKLTLMPVGSLDVSGMSVEDLHNLLVEKYKFYLRNPQIVIRLDKTKPFVVYVSGAVLYPGSFELDTDTTKSQNMQQTFPDIRIDRKTPLLSNILVAAGGITNEADLEHIKISNKLTGTEIEVNLLEVVLNGDANQDLYLMPGDSIMVPKLANPSEAHYEKYANATFAQRQIPVRVFGYVSNPGLVKVDTQQSNHLISAIAAAGGYYHETAYAPKKVILSRFENGKMTKRELDPMTDDVTLFPNDLIYVPDKSKPVIGRAFDYMVRVIAPFATYGSAFNNWALMFNPKRYSPYNQAVISK